MHRSPIGSPASRGETLVEVAGVSKKYCRDLKRSLVYGVKDLARELTARPAESTLRPQEFWALRDISFEVSRGEALGVIGPNGAGKSTLLKLLNGLVKPNTGRIRMRGRVQALIELGAGFNPILTGRENIYINAAVLGIGKREIDRRLDDIIAFAELEEFVDTPVRSYSSGMKVRLGFSIALHVQPDVLIIDEVLAVGDARFRRRARNALDALVRSEVALIFVSHNIHEVLGVTDRVLWLDHGRTVRLGDTQTVAPEYVHWSESEADDAPEPEFRYMEKRSGELALRDVRCRAGEREMGRAVRLGSDRELAVELEFEAGDAFDEPVLFGLGVALRDGTRIAHAILNDHLRMAKGERLDRRFVLDLEALQPGSYQVWLEVGTEGGPRLEGVHDLLSLEVAPWPEAGGGRERGSLNQARMKAAHGPVLLPCRLEESGVRPAG